MYTKQVMRIFRISTAKHILSNNNCDVNDHGTWLLNSDWYSEVFLHNCFLDSRYQTSYKYVCMWVKFEFYVEDSGKHFLLGCKMSLDLLILIFHLYLSYERTLQTFKHVNCSTDIVEFAVK